MPNNIPTEPGYYWHRDIDEASREAFEWEPYQVTRAGIEFAVKTPGGLYPISLPLVKGEWGPRIPDPEELQEKAEADAMLGEAIKRSIQKGHDMTRDKLAEKFLVGILANGQRLGSEDGVTLRTDLAYRYADAMLAKRGKQQ